MGLGERIQAEVDHNNRGRMVCPFTVADRVWIKRAMGGGGLKLQPLWKGAVKLNSQDG